MGVFAKLFGRPTPPVPLPVASVSNGRQSPDAVWLAKLGVVGESYYQDNLWRAVPRAYSPGAQVAYNTVASLVAEPDNQHDRNAIKVLIDQRPVGYLERDDAEKHRAGLLRLIASSKGGAIAVDATIVGGSAGMLGVFLQENSTNGARKHSGGFRTGLSEAITTDAADHSYDLSWFSTVTGNGALDIPSLRKLLTLERDPIDRHYMFTVLGASLYRSRADFSSALEEFDAVCDAHHAEMGTIRPALLAKFNQVPMIEMYKQAAVRSMKAHDYPSALEWAERGLAVYGNSAARSQDVADLQMRAGKATAKMAVASKPVKAARPPRPMSETPAPVVESLRCNQCGGTFERIRTRGRKPHLCPTCR